MVDGVGLWRLCTNTRTDWKTRTTIHIWGGRYSGECGQNSTAVSRRAKIYHVVVFNRKIEIGQIIYRGVAFIKKSKSIKLLNPDQRCERRRSWAGVVSLTGPRSSLVVQCDPRSFPSWRAQMGSHDLCDRCSSNHAPVGPHLFLGMVLGGTCMASLTDCPGADGDSQAGSPLGRAHRSGVESLGG